jgi:hypothetical protein
VILLSVTGATVSAGSAELADGVAAAPATGFGATAAGAKALPAQAVEISVENHSVVRMSQASQATLPVDEPFSELPEASVQKFRTTRPSTRVELRARVPHAEMRGIR